MRRRRRRAPSPRQPGTASPGSGRAVGGAGGTREVINGGAVMRGGRDGRQRPPGPLPVDRSGPGTHQPHPELPLPLRPHGLRQLPGLPGTTRLLLRSAFGTLARC